MRKKLLVQAIYHILKVMTPVITIVLIITTTALVYMAFDSTRSTATFLSITSLFILIYLTVVAMYRLVGRLRITVGDGATNKISISGPVWLIRKEASLVGAELVINRNDGLYMVSSNGKKEHIGYQDIEYFRHSYNLRLPLIYIVMKNGERNILAFVGSYKDVKALNKQTATALALGEPLAVMSSPDSAVKSTFNQYKEDKVETVFQWFISNRPDIYKNKISRNFFLLLALLTTMFVIMPLIGLTIETIFDR